MRLKLMTAILLLSALTSCKDEKEPAGILSQAQMVDFMLAVYLDEARAAALNTSRDSVYRIFLPRQDSLLMKRGIADSTLNKSYTYYLENPVKFEAIYDIVIDSLSLREQKILAKKTPPAP